MSLTRLLVHLIMALLLGAVSCSRGGHLDPLAPASTPTPSDPAAPLGLLAGTIYPDGHVALRESRAASGLGAIYDLDATQFFTMSPCTDCARLAGAGFDAQGNLKLDIGLRHPFPAESARKDLHVFDVRGILITPGATGFGELLAPVNQDLTTITTEAIVGDPRLVLNADGFTTHFDWHAEDARYVANPTPIPGNLNPYKRYFEDPGLNPFNPQDPSGWNVMPQGAPEEVQSFVINAARLVSPMPFVFVVDARWGEAATRDTRDTPTYYLPAFNRQEAWDVQVTVFEDTLQTGDPTSFARIEVAVKDWQAGALVAAAFPDPAHPTQVAWPSEVAEVNAQVPGVSGLVTVNAPASGGGTHANPYRYALTLYNELGNTLGDFVGLVQVKDELFGQDGPIAVPELDDVFAGLNLRDYATYQSFMVHVDMPVDDPPLADASATDPTSIVSGQAVSLDGSRSRDDGAIANYTWNPGDGGAGVDGGTNPILSHVYTLPNGVPQRLYAAELTVTDDTGNQSTDSIQITVSETADQPPVAELAADPTTITSGDTVDFDASGSSDDFAIASYRFNPGDGTGWVDQGTTDTYAHLYLAPISTTYNAQLEVIDSSGARDTTFVLITVASGNAPPVADLSQSAPVSGDAPLLVTFDGTLSSDDSAISRYEWDPGDGSGWHDTGATPTFQHTYDPAVASDYTARLRVTDAGNLTDLASIEIAVTIPPPACNLTGITGPTRLNLGEVITLSAAGTAGAYQWSTTSSAVAFVGSTTGPTVQVQGAEVSLANGDVPITLSNTTSTCVVSTTLTVYDFLVVNPAFDTQRYVNFPVGGDPSLGNEVVVTAQVQPVKSGVPITFTFTDPDEPAYQSVDGTSWTQGGDFLVDHETDATASDNLGDSLRPNGASAPGSYSNGFKLGGNVVHTLQLNSGTDGRATATFRLSRYGGDNYQFVFTGDPAGNGASLAQTSATVTAWRKYFAPLYSMRNASGSDPDFYLPDFSQVNAMLAPVYIEVVDLATGFDNMTYLSPLSTSTSAQFDFVETGANYATSAEVYAQRDHGMFAGGIDRYTVGGTIGLWTGAFFPSRMPPQGVDIGDKPYTTRNYLTVATGRMRDFWSGAMLIELQNHVFVHEFGHALGLPHNDSGTGGDPALSKHGASGIGLMAPATGPGIKHVFTLAESRFLRGQDTVSGVIYRGPWYE